MNRGHWQAMGAYVLWGLFPIYWKLLLSIPPIQLLCHRILWSFLLLFAAILLARQRKSFIMAALRLKIMPWYILAAGLIGVNWLTYVWAVNAGFIVQTSLGYFINPLLSVLIGVIVLHERLRPWQWVPVGLAATGILYLTFAHGSLPWIALTLAFTWAIYGLVKKIAPLGSLHGLTLETGILLAPVVAYLIYADRTGHGAFLHHGFVIDLLLIGAGVVTTVPLWLFASAVRQVPLSIIGMLQYIAPTLQFLIGVLVFKEPFTSAQFVGFGLVWAGLIIFGVENYLTHRSPSESELEL
jgi:chloramphenicol-sensitive protein RarD